MKSKQKSFETPKGFVLRGMGWFVFEHPSPLSLLSLNAI